MQRPANRAAPNSREIEAQMCAQRAADALSSERPAEHRGQETRHRRPCAIGRRWWQEPAAERPQRRFQSNEGDTPQPTVAIIPAQSKPTPMAATSAAARGRNTPGEAAAPGAPAPREATLGDSAERCARPPASGMPSARRPAATISASDGAGATGCARNCQASAAAAIAKAAPKMPCPRRAASPAVRKAGSLGIGSCHQPPPIRRTAGGTRRRARSIARQAISPVSAGRANPTPSHRHPSVGLSAHSACRPAPARAASCRREGKANGG